MDVDQLEKELVNYPDRESADRFISELRNGVYPGFRELPSDSFVCKNNLSAIRNPEIVDELLQKEVEKGYVIGPLDDIPFESYRISPISIATKKYADPPKPRLVVDYSSPHDDPDHPSLNDLISKEDFSLTYTKIDEAIKIIQTYGPNTWLCKTDLTDAFKQIMVHPSVWGYQGIRWRNKYYFFTRLVFGCRSSPALFDQLSRMIVWIAKNNYGIDVMLFLLDDFLCIDKPDHNAFRTMAILTLILNKLRIPYSLKKTVGPVYSLEYLGLILDTVNMLCQLPDDKLCRMKRMITEFLGKVECTKREMLSLCGNLSYASRVVVSGRSFMFRLFRVAHSVDGLEEIVRIPKFAKYDLVMWLHFLNHWNGVSLFIENEATLADDMQLFTDASGNKDLGFGGYFQKSWFFGGWPKEILSRLSKKASIAFRELYPIVVAAILYGKSWSRKRIIFNCDNKGTCFIVNKGYSNKSEDIMRLMRRFTLVAAQFSFSYEARYLPGRYNKLADNLSRFKFQAFRKLAPEANDRPDEVPPPSEVMFG